MATTGLLHTTSVKISFNDHSVYVRWNKLRCQLALTHDSLAVLLLDTYEKHKVDDDSEAMPALAPIQLPVTTGQNFDQASAQNATQIRMPYMPATKLTIQAPLASVSVPFNIPSHSDGDTRPESSLSLSALVYDSFQSTPALAHGPSLKILGVRNEPSKQVRTPNQDSCENKVLVRDISCTNQQLLSLQKVVHSTSYDEATREPPLSVFPGISNKENSTAIWITNNATTGPEQRKTRKRDEVGSKEADPMIRRKEEEGCEDSTEYLVPVPCTWELGRILSQQHPDLVSDYDDKTLYYHDSIAANQNKQGISSKGHGQLVEGSSGFQKKTAEDKTSRKQSSNNGNSCSFIVVKPLSSNEASPCTPKLKTLSCSKMAGDSDERPFECNKCNKTFKTKSSLHRHDAVHTRPYHCHLCEKKFSCPGDLKSHIRTHTKERPFVCHHCGQRFVQKNHLKNHMHLHDKYKNTHKCNLCSASFPSKHGLASHAKSHSEGNKYRCSLCSKRFKHPSYIDAHVQRVHKDTIKV